MYSKNKLPWDEDAVLRTMEADFFWRTERMSDDSLEYILSVSNSTVKDSDLYYLNQVYLVMILDLYEIG